MSRRRVSLLAFSLSCALVISGLMAPAGATARAGGGEKSVTLFPVSVRETSEGSVGGAHPVTIHLREGGGDTFRVGFTEDEVAGTGDQWRAAGWNAATVATLLTGSPLGGNEITFDLNGRIDGPSAGALMTIGVLSLLRGDKIKKNITMTGTINPDGTVGPVGGIPYKVDGVVEAKKTRMLIPIGQRNSPDDTGAPVDVVDLGLEKGVQVSEVADIYEAYEEFTGNELPRPQGGDVELSPRAYDALEGFVNDWLTEFDGQAGLFNSLDPSIQELFLDTIVADANAAQQRAVSLSQQGLQAGAYVDALEAAGPARAAVTAGNAVQTLLTAGVEAFKSEIVSTAAVEDKVDALVEQLKAQKPKTLGQVSALIDGYGNAFDALAVTLFAQDLFAQADAAPTIDEALEPALTGALFYSIVGTQVDAAEQLLDLAPGGARLKKEVDPEQAADFFRKAAEANFQAFETIFVESQADASGISSDQVREFLAGQDFGYALTQAGFNLVENEGIEEALGGGTNAAFGDLGGSVALYVRANSLIAKYYALIGASCLDESLEPVCASNERALTSALDLAEGQVEGGIAVLRDKNVDPTFEAGAYESARVGREGDIGDKLDALDSFLAAFIKSRILAYLGGFPTAGLE
ncbi:MAG: S16 family serine protease [Acidimicrobiia bacterium]